MENTSTRSIDMIYVITGFSFKGQFGHFNLWVKLILMWAYQNCFFLSEPLALPYCIPLLFFFFFCPFLLFLFLPANPLPHHCSPIAWPQDTTHIAALWPEGAETSMPEAAKPNDVRLPVVKKKIVWQSVVFQRSSHWIAVILLVINCSWTHLSNYTQINRWKSPEKFLIFHADSFETWFWPVGGEFEGNNSKLLIVVKILRNYIYIYIYIAYIR